MARPLQVVCPIGFATRFNPHTMATTASAPARTRAAPKVATKSAAKVPTTTTTLTITSKNYSSWSLRGWLVTRFSGLDFVENVLPPDDPSTRAEILLLSSSILVPCLTHDGIKVWDTLAIAEYLNEVCPKAGLLPADAKARAHCRAICGEMHSGFSALRSSLPMNLRGHFPKFKIWSRAQADIDHICNIWRDCLDTYGGPYLFGKKRTVADAMYAPVCTRFATYDVKLDAACADYCNLMLQEPEMKEWFSAAKAEKIDNIDELDVEF
ncbi:glutathione S-transferase family protein [Aquabacterium sp. CECT 9606]|uniref:glutathione S-transferase family protein n=1 Tax=Aquabacterium sp. CECT 9606 TaxID=2845822 RepID=UPI001E4D0D52|nr:glutathione S-transferase family protein [Aquabacterium sp. CECT 9606]CAH0348169.1 hypothetical protein AQB9606_00391 [Aquabacterium sp. CECT 9606]